jgi:hypothetical protein
MASSSGHHWPSQSSIAGQAGHHCCSGSCVSATSSRRTAVPALNRITAARRVLGFTPIQSRLAYKALLP